MTIGDCLLYRLASSVCSLDGYDPGTSTLRRSNWNSLARSNTSADNRGQLASDPYVMLSPNATKRTASTDGTRCTVIEKPQVLLRRCASSARQVTLEVPAGNEDPLGGVQFTETGAVPPVTVGAAYDTGAVRSTVSTACEAGHEIVGPGVGSVGVPRHPAASDTRMRAARNRMRRHGGDPASENRGDTNRGR
jgi:hypothetical protein